MCFSLVAVSLCGAQGTQRYKAAENSAFGVGQVSVQGTLQIQICSQNTDTGELTVRSKDLAVQQTLE